MNRDDTVKIRPNVFLFWTPRWRDWRTSVKTDNTTSADALHGLDLDLILDLTWDFLWNRCGLWMVAAAIVLALEVCVAVVLAPVALLTSLLGVPRHRLVAVSEDGGAQHSPNRGSWYAMRGARAEARAQLAREPNASAHP